MNAVHMRWKLAVAIAASAFALRTAAALERDEFVAGWPIELPATSQGVFDVPLTLDVYRTAQEIGQIAILDERGEPMPFYRVGAPPLTATEERETLGASPLYAVPSGSAVADVSVASGADRTNVTLTRPAGVVDPKAVGFVVDAREVERAPVAVELDWRELERPFLMEVTIEHSATLTDWRPVGRGSVAALSLDGARVRHDRVPVAAQAGGYYRIAVSSTVPEWFVENVTLIRTEAESAPELESVSVAPSGARQPAGSDEAFYFDAGGKLPVGALTLDFAATNGWARASVASADSAEGPWRTVVPTRLFYETVLEDMELASPPVEIGRVQARHWRVLFEDGAPTQAVELELRYPQESLRFAADGTAPYLLSAGTLSNTAGPDPTFAAVWNELQAAGGTATAAALGERMDLGGAAALDEPFEFPWRRAALWAVLGIGVLAVGWMAVRLGREMFGRP